MHTGSQHQPLIAWFEAGEDEPGVDTSVPFQQRHTTSEPLSRSTVDAITDATVVSCFIRSIVDREILQRLPNLKLIATRSTGYDHVDLNACRERGIVVANVPYYGENTVAEHTFGLILTISRNLHHAYQRTLNGNFSPKGLTGFDLKGKKLGVVGTGSIGLHVVRIGRGFGMDVLAHDIHEQHLLADVLGFTYVPLEDLLHRSDVISLHVPASPATEQLINRERLDLMKQGAILVNTARGTLVDTEALLRALDDGKLAGAGLDVLAGEEYLEDELQVLGEPGMQERLRILVTNHALLHRPNVVFTPHIAFNSQEALQRIHDTTIANIEGFLTGQPRNLVSA